VRVGDSYVYKGDPVVSPSLKLGLLYNQDYHLPLNPLASLAPLSFASKAYCNSTASSSHSFPPRLTSLLLPEVLRNRKTCRFLFRL
jgi:hypothetical protein